MKYSVVIIAENEADNLTDCINSAVGADEFIVIDDDSSDRTAEIARDLGAKVYQRTLDGFATQKNFGIDKATNDWVLILDADERLTPELADEITGLKVDDKITAYQIAFRNFVGHTWLRHGGLYPDYHARLFDKTKARYGSRQVHEELETNGRIDRLNHDIIHLTYKNWREYYHKVKKYARLEAKSDRSRPSWTFITKTFYRKYVKDRGFLDGPAGLTSALLLAYYQYLKRRELTG